MSVYADKGGSIDATAPAITLIYGTNRTTGRSTDGRFFRDRGDGGHIFSIFRIGGGRRRILSLLLTRWWGTTVCSAGETGSTSSSGKGVSSTKEAKKEGKPKAPQSAYMFYANSNREKVKSQEPSITFGALGSKLGALWKGLDEKEKEQYNRMAAEDKLRFQRETAKWREEHPNEAEESGKRKSKKSKKEKDPLAPKKALSAYFMFIKAQRPKEKLNNPTLSFAELGKLMGEKWTAMSDDQKKPYVEQALADKERYNKETENYTPGKVKKPAPAKVEAKAESSESEESEEDGGSDE